jgi:hypothetical protein
MWRPSPERGVPAPTPSALSMRAFVCRFGLLEKFTVAPLLSTRFSTTGFLAGALGAFGAFGVFCFLGTLPSARSTAGSPGDPDSIDAGFFLLLLGFTSAWGTPAGLASSWVKSKGTRLDIVWDVECRHLCASAICIRNRDAHRVFYLESPQLASCVKELDKDCMLCCARTVENGLKPTQGRTDSLGRCCISSCPFLSSPPAHAVARSNTLQWHHFSAHGTATTIMLAYVRSRPACGMLLFVK